MPTKNKAQALHEFWAGFGLPAIDELSSYDDRTMKQLGIAYPYLTYEEAVGDFDEPISLGADLYYRSDSWAEIEAKAAEISDAIGMGGKIVLYDGGGIWIKRGSPPYRRMSAENEFSIRRIHLNINADFLSA